MLAQKQHTVCRSREHIYMPSDTKSMLWAVGVAHAMTRTGPATDCAVSFFSVEDIDTTAAGVSQRQPWIINHVAGCKEPVGEVWAQTPTPSPQHSSSHLLKCDTRVISDVPVSYVVFNVMSKTRH